MIQRKVTIKNSLGLHARPAVTLVQTASKFRSDIKIAKDDLEIDGKSILGVLMLAAEKGSEMVLKVDGDDEKEALEELIKLFESGFGED